MVHGTAIGDNDDTKNMINNMVNKSFNRNKCLS